MALKTILTADEHGALDEAQRDLYEKDEKTDRFVLAVDGIDDHPSIAALRNGHRNSKRERDEAKQKAQDLERRFGKLLTLADDLDLEDAEEDTLSRVVAYLKGEGELDEDDDENGGKGGKKGNQPDIEKIKANARKPLERDLSAMTEERDKYKSQLEQVVVDNALTDALIKAKVGEPYMAPLKSHFSKSVKIAEGDDGAPQAMIEGEYGEQAVAAYIKDWSQSDEGKAFIQAGGNSGGGSNGTGGGGGSKIKNPWDPKTLNVTEQMRIYREDPTKAKRMAAEHGVTLR